VSGARLVTLRDEMRPREPLNAPSRSGAPRLRWLRIAGLALGSLLLAAAAACASARLGPLCADRLAALLPERLELEGVTVELTPARTRLYLDGTTLVAELAVREVRALDGALRLEPFTLRLRHPLAAVLGGQVTPTRVELDAPRITVGLAELEVSPPWREGPGPAPAELAAGIQRVLEQLTHLRQTPELLVRGASLRVLREGRAVGALDDVWLSASLGPQGLRAAVLPGGALAGQALFVSRARPDAATDLTLSLDDLVASSLAEVGLPSLSESAISLSGALEASLDRRLGLAAVDFSLEADAADLPLPEPFSRRLALDSAHVEGRFEPASSRLQLDGIELHALGSRFEGAAVLGRSGEGLQLRVRTAQLTPAALEAAWPRHLEPSVRAWFLEGVRARFSDVTLEAALTREELAAGRFSEERVALDFGFDGAEVRFARTMSPLVKARGRGRLTPGRLELSIATGELGGLSAAGSLSIPSFARERAHVVWSGSLEGPLPRALALLDQPPLGLARAAGISPSDAGGDVLAQLRLKLPLGRALRREDLDYRAEVALREASLPRLGGRYSLAHGALALRVDPRALVARGRAQLNGVPVELEWREPLLPGGVEPRRLRLRASLDEAGRRAFALPTWSWLEGPVRVDVAVTEPRGGTRSLEAQLELDPATVTFPVIGWKKPPGTPAQVKLQARERVDGGLTIARLELRAATMRLDGRVEVRPDGELERATLDRIESGENRFSAVVSRRGPGVQHVAVTGARLDLRAALGFDEVPTAVAPPPRPPRLGPRPGDPVWLFTASLDRVRVTQSLILRDVSARGRAGPQRVEELRTQARLPGRSHLRLTMQPSARGRSLSVEAGDAGQLISALGIYNNVSGGSLELTGELRDDLAEQPFDGRARLGGFRLRQAPTLAHILHAGSLLGIVDVLRGKGILFERAEIPLVLSRQTVKIGPATASGPALGLTAEGIFDRAARRARITGTIVPLYAFNSLLGHIPVLGRLLIPRGEGLFAPTYSLQGSVDAPKVSVNPLSSLVPGFLRRLLFGR
jgi:hypothetical protein